MHGGGKYCPCPHHKVKPVCILLIGLAFLFAKLGWLPMETVSWIWPILLVVIGGTKLFSGKCKCC